MSAQQFPADPLAALAPPTVSLRPLRSGGQTALAPDLTTEVLNMALTEVVASWHNAFNEIIVYRADDLLACAARQGKSGDPFPNGAELVQATLNIRFCGSSQPHQVRLVPPHTLTFQNPQDAARLLPLLARRGFTGENAGPDPVQRAPDPDAEG